MLTSLGLFALAAVAAQAAVVDSIELSHPLVIDGLSTDSKGDVYAAGGWNGPYVCRISTDGAVETIARDLAGPIHAVVGPDGDLYVSEFNAGQVIRIEASGEKTVVAKTPPGPSGLAFDSSGALYVASFGSMQGDGDAVTRIGADGRISAYAQGGGIAAPIGLAFDDDETLYVANSKDGRIHRVSSSGEIELVATIPGPRNFFNTGHLVFVDGALYASGNGTHKVYRVTLDGEVQAIAGSGRPGETDGRGAEASLRIPNGLTADPDASALYVVSGAGRPNMTLRRIELAISPGA